VFIPRCNVFKFFLVHALIALGIIVGRECQEHFFIFESHVLHNALIICYFCIKLNYLGIIFDQGIVALLYILNFT